MIEVAFFANLFNLERFSVSPDKVIDHLERAIGVYKADYNASIWRTGNPFWWIGQVITWFAHLPFAFMGAAGFNSARVERSVVGRLIKAVFAAVPVVASVLVIANLLGWIDVFKSIFGN